MRGRVSETERVDWAKCCERAASVQSSASKAAILLGFIQDHPAGSHNRRAAEEIEWLLDEVTDLSRRAHLNARLRAVRDSVLPPVRPNSWVDDMYYGSMAAASSLA